MSFPLPLFPTLFGLLYIGFLPHALGGDFCGRKLVLKSETTDTPSSSSGGEPMAATQDAKFVLLFLIFFGGERTSFKDRTILT
jgi:hypothetical protein